MFSNKYASDIKSKSKNGLERKLKFANLYYAYKDYEMARQCINDYVEGRPDSAAGHFLKGKIHEALGESEKALMCYQKSLELDVGQKDVLSSICRLLVQHPTDNDTTRFWIEKAQKTIPSDENIPKLQQLVNEMDINASIEVNGYSNHDISDREETHSNRSYYFTPVSTRFGSKVSNNNTEALQQISQKIEEKLSTIIRNQEEFIKMMREKETSLLHANRTIVDAVQEGTECLRFLTDKVDSLQATLEQMQLSSSQNYANIDHVSPDLQLPYTVQDPSTAVQQTGGQGYNLLNYDTDYFANCSEQNSNQKSDTSKDKVVMWPAAETTSVPPFSVKFKDSHFAEAFHKAMDDAEKYEETAELTPQVTAHTAQDIAGSRNNDNTSFHNKLKPLSEVFKAPANSWQCEICYVNNTGDAQACAACETPKPGSSVQAATFNFTFGIPNTSANAASSSSTQPNKPVFGDFPSFSFGASTLETTGTFSNSTPKFQENTPVAATALGIEKTSNLPESVFGSAPADLAKSSDLPKPVFGNTPSVFTFGTTDLQKTTSIFGITDTKSQNTSSGVFGGGFKFGEPDPTFQFGSSQNFSFKFDGVQSPKSAASPEKPPQNESNDSLDHSHEDSFHFKPVVNLPPVVEVKTGEEDEAILFSERAKLFRYANNEWKERGLGEIKILHDTSKNRVRLLMRRDQVLKVCLNHYISENLELTPKESGGDDKEARAVKSYVWSATDFSEGTGVAEVFAIRFKNSTIADSFKRAIEESKVIISNEVKVEGEETRDIVDSECEVIYVKEPQSPEKAQKAAELKLPKNFYDYENAEPCLGCHGCTDTMPTLFHEKIDDREHDISESTTSATNLFSAALAEHGASSSWASKTSSSSPWTTTVPVPVFGAAKEETAEEDTCAGSDFKPVIPLPNLVDVKTGEENESVLFLQRAKLYRYDANAKQWKERGVGDFKILKHNETGKCRLLLRRDQVFKIACNHYITKSLSFSPMPNSQNALCWSAVDFSEGSPVTEKLAVKFKNEALLQEFRKKIEEVQNEITDD